MKQENTQSNPIRVHCTVDRKYIKTDGQNIICTQCDRKLLNLCEGGDKVTDFQSSNGRTHCGIYAGVTAAALVASLALSSCSQKDHQLDQLYIGSPIASISEPIQASKSESERYPEAKWIGANYDAVRSPYSSGYVRLINDIPPGSLVNQPFTNIEEKKYFRIPQKTLANIEQPEGEK